MGEDFEKKEPISHEREFEIGMDEAWKANMKMLFDFTLANMKRTYDEYQQASLESIKQNQSYVQKVLSDAQQHDNERQKISSLALANAVNNSDMMAKQAIRHADIAIDNQWNPVQQGAGDTLTARAVTLDDASLKAIGASVANALTAAIASFANVQNQTQPQPKTV